MNAEDFKRLSERCRRGSQSAIATAERILAGLRGEGFDGETPVDEQETDYESSDDPFGQ